jgi:hypothetical protein
VPQPTAFRAPARDLFGQGASGQDMAVLGAVAPGRSSVAEETAAAAPAQAKDSHPLFGEDGFTFSDFLDIINPLQHIPVVSTVYRAITGDRIDPGARIAGGGLFGGPIGLVASMISGMVEEATGKDPGEHALAALGIDIGPTSKDAPQTMLAEAAPQSNDTVPAEPAALQAQGAQLQATQARKPDEDLKLGVTMDDGRGRRAAEKAVADSRVAKGDGPIELPADLFQALKQTAATQQADARASAANGAMANPIPGQPVQTRVAGPMQANTAATTPDNAIRSADGRNWYPAFPSGSGGAPTRGVGTSPVTQMNATSKFGVTKGASATPQQVASPQAASAASTAAMLIGQQENAQNEWAARASDAYQKYFEMQNDKNRRAGIVQ